jgi:endonuclease IV
VQIGAHVSSSGGIDKAIDRAVAIGADSVQVFTQSPRAWRPTNHDPASFKRFREKSAAAGLGGALCHAVYLTNLASPDPVTYERSVATLRNTTEVACHLFVSGVDVRDPAALDGCLDELDASIGLDRLRALHVNDSAAPFASNRDRHANILEGELGEKLGVFLANPRLQGLPAVLETAGPDNHGPDASEVAKTKELRDRWL